MNATFKNRKKFFFFPLIVTAAVFGGGYLVMLLWNSILPSVITSVNSVTYLQATGMLILCRILFGGFKGRGGCAHPERGGPPWKEKMMEMNDVDREKFKSEWKERCGRK